MFLPEFGTYFTMVLYVNEEKFRFCPSEKNMDKLLDDLSPFTCNTIVKYVPNSGKNIQHYPDYMVMKPFEGGVNFLLKDTFITSGPRITKRAKPFISEPFAIEVYGKVNPHIK